MHTIISRVQLGVNLAREVEARWVPSTNGKHEQTNLSQICQFHATHTWSQRLANDVCRIMMMSQAYDVGGTPSR
jgi:hypothetical protein